MIIKPKLHKEPLLEISEQKFNEIISIIYNNTYFNTNIDPVEDPEYLPLIYHNGLFAIGQYDHNPLKLERQDGLHEIYIDMSEVTNSIESQKEFSKILLKLNYIVLSHTLKEK